MFHMKTWLVSISDSFIPVTVGSNSWESCPWWTEASMTIKDGLFWWFLWRLTVWASIPFWCSFESVQLMTPWGHNQVSFAFISVLLEDWHNKTFTQFTSGKVLPMFSSRYFMVLCFTCKSLSLCDTSNILKSILQ